MFHTFGKVLNFKIVSFVYMKIFVFVCVCKSHSQLNEKLLWKMNEKCTVEKWKTNEKSTERHTFTQVPKTFCTIKPRERNGNGDGTLINSSWHNSQLSTHYAIRKTWVYNNCIRCVFLVFLCVCWAATKSTGIEA